jgi:PAS domain S-box-containing protein
MPSDPGCESIEHHPIDEILDTAPCGFLSIDDSGTIVAINTTLLEVLGYELNAVVGQPIALILPVASRIFYQTHIFPLLKLHNKVEEIYFSMRSALRHDIPVLLNASRRERRNCVINDFIVIPIVQRIQYEDAILKAKKEAETAIQAEYEANAALEKTQTALKSKQAELLQLNAKLEDLVQQRTDQLQQALNFKSLLQRITDKVRDSLDEGHILQAAIHELGIGLSVEYGNIRVCKPSSALVITAYEYSKTPPTGDDLAIDVALACAISYPFKVQTHAYQFCPIASDESLFSSLAGLVCPVFDDQGVLGDIWLFRLEACGFNELELQLVQQVANHCAIALRQSRLYQAAQHQVQELERLNQLKDDFLSTISHELRTPMSNIKMATQMLEINLQSLNILTNESANSINRYFKILHEEGQREIGLINDLLDITRLDAGTESFSPTSVTLQCWLPHIVESFAERIHSQQQTLQLNIADHLPPLTTDVFYLERILIELITNACKYTPAQETITLSAQTTLTGLEICVTNTGVEIDPEEHDRIFDKFYRIPNNDPWKYGGTGLGLALVKKLADHLDASIHVKSGDRQTSFILEFEHSRYEKNESS